MELSRCRSPNQPSMNMPHAARARAQRDDDYGKRSDASTRPDSASTVHARSETSCGEKEQGRQVHGETSDEGHRAGRRATG